MTTDVSSREPSPTALPGTATDLATPVRVSVKRLCAEGVVTVELVDLAGRQLPAWEPGAHIDIEIADRHVRQYSLCGDPADRSRYRIGVLREMTGRGTSLHIHDQLDVGDYIVVRGPRNNFALRPSPRYVFVAGGIGITPLLPMIRAAAVAGADWRLAYGGRQRSSMAFLDELAGYGDRVQVCPQDETGLLDLPTVVGEPRADTLVYCCGPEPLLAAMETACRDWPAYALQLERFSPRATTGAPAATQFEVVLEQSGKTLTVSADKSILQTVRDAGIGALFSCEEGTCGTCETRIIDGIADHRDSILDDEEREEGESMMICVSRARTPRLVLNM